MRAALQLQFSSVKRQLIEPGSVRQRLREIRKRGDERGRLTLCRKELLCSHCGFDTAVYTLDLPRVHCGGLSLGGDGHGSGFQTSMRHQQDQEQQNKIEHEKKHELVA